MVTRRGVLASVGGVLAAARAMRPAFAASAGYIGDDGLHKQDWFMDSFLEVGEDLKEAAADGRDYMILVEQAGCPYCRELHEVNFARDDIVSYIKAHFNVVQLDLFGSREAVDFDGTAFEERDLVFKWGVQFTPTTLLYSAENAGAATFLEAETFRLPGYLKPFHYLRSLEYVAEDHYKSMSFQRYLQIKLAEYRAKGIDPGVW